MRRSTVLAVALCAALGGPGMASAAPEGQMTWAVHISIAPTWFDPAENPGIVTPMIVLYALHDALVKPMPGTPMAPGLAESWSVSRDGLTYEFALRKGVVFHNGESLTAEDVKFSFERYRGGAAKLLKERVSAVEILDPHRVRFRLKEPWPDFMAFFGTPATGAAWIVPKAYVEKVGDEGFKKAPVGAGPYKLLSFKPGVELVLEAHERYWRKPPNVKRLVFRVIPDEATRLAMLKRGEVDIDFYWAPPPFPYDPAQARKLLAEAGYPNGFDAGDYACDVSYANLGEAVANYLNAVGIRVKLRPMERAAFMSQWRDKKLRSLVQGQTGAYGNAATRIENYMIARGVFAYGSYPELDELFQQQVREGDRKKREALLHQIQKVAHEKVMFGPIWELAFLNGVGPRVEEAGLGLIEYQPYSTPYEELRLKRP